MAKAEINLVEGTEDADDLTGTPGRDRIAGGAGADRIDGGAGSDILLGEGGDDTFVPSPGADRIDGGNGIDSIDASGFRFGVYVNLFSLDYTDYSSGTPTFGLKLAAGTLKLGGSGPHDGWTVQQVVSIEHFTGSAFDDLFRAINVNATIRTGRGNDKVSLIDGFARLIGGSGNDDLGLGDGGTALGGAGDDILRGGGRDHASHLLGGAGDDLLITTARDVAKGGAGNDRLLVTESNSSTRLIGGAGADTFDFGYFHSGFIQDFQPGRDKVDISAHATKVGATWADLASMFEAGETGARLTFDFPEKGLVGQYIEFVGLSAGALSADDFILA